jgi:hypothetical protein
MFVSGFWQAYPEPPHDSKIRVKNTVIVPPDWMRPALADVESWCSRLPIPLSGDSCWASELAPSWAPERIPWHERSGSPKEYYSLIRSSGSRNTSEFNWAAAVGEIINRRRSLALGGPSDSRGRLLAFLPDENLADGATEQASEGFFDVDNIPAWGTWVGFTNRDDPIVQDTRGRAARALIAWVPGELVSLASQGVEVNPEVCILWLSS